jgi:tetratricopeptide (TPR) repeat protein
VSIRRNNVTFFILLILSMAALSTAAKAEPAKKGGAAQEIPLTTNSAEAREFFQQGRTYRENWRLPEALQAWRSAALKDPNFALAHLYVSFFTPDPKEEAKARAQARRLAPRASRGEQLMIEWYAGAKEGNFVPAIAAMNDVLELFPRDKWLLFQAGRWLILQRRMDKGQPLLERALAVDPDYTAALNQIGYLYASSGPQFEKSFKAFEHYSHVRPKEPNPQDSWAEVLRMAGEYQKSLEHYRKALEIDPHFAASQLGIADNYAMMGDESRARSEYEKAIAMTPNHRDQISYKSQIALTYVREGNLDEADQQYLNVAKEARELGLADMEADCHRYMAMYQTDVDKALKHLEEAEKIIQNNHTVDAEHMNMALSRVFYVRAWRGAKAARTSVIAEATTQLEKLSRRSGSNLIRQQYQAAAGMLALAHGKYPDAVAHMEEEDLSTHLISMEQAALAYEKNGNHEEASKLREAVKRSNVPGIEFVLVVAPLRNGNAVAGVSKP